MLEYNFEKQRYVLIMYDTHQKSFNNLKTNEIHHLKTNHESQWITCPQAPLLVSLPKCKGSLTPVIVFGD